MQPSTKPTAAQLRAQLTQLNQQLAELEAAEAREADLKRFQSELSNLNQQIETTETTLRDLNNKAATLLVEKGQLETILLGG